MWCLTAKMGLIRTMYVNRLGRISFFKPCSYQVLIQMAVFVRAALLCCGIVLL